MRQSRDTIFENETLVVECTSTSLRDFDSFQRVTFRSDIAKFIYDGFLRAQYFQKVSVTHVFFT